MLQAAGLLAAALGSWLAAIHLGAGGPPKGWLRLAHGAAGAATAALMLRRLWAAGWQASHFEWDTATLLGAALALGLLLAAAWSRLGRARGVVIATHALVGISGVVLLLSWVG